MKSITILNYDNLIEEKLHDYENMTELILISKDIFNYLSNKIDNKISSYKSLIKKNEFNEKNESISIDETS